jgi:hypothetical protein
MDVTIFIFQLLHMYSLPSLVVLTPPRIPCTPFIDYAHLSAACVNSSIDCENTSITCTNFFANYGNKFDDPANTPYD